jgi:hypothetical protein
MNPRTLLPEEFDKILSPDFQVRFFSKVNKTETCWNWTASVDFGGYGHVRVCRSLMKTHRVAWMMHNKCLVPDGLDILHSCVGNTRCCNPEHLRPGTDADNSGDKMAQGRNFIPRVKGERHGMSKLKEEQIIEIRKLHATGKYRQKDIGEMFGVTRSMISYVVNGKNWTHLKPLDGTAPIAQ